MPIFATVVMLQTGTKSLENDAGFRVLFESATIGILVVGSDGRIELVNPCAEKLFGYEAAELIGDSVETLIPEDLRQRHARYRERYFSGPKARPMGLGLELFARRHDSTVFPVEISLGHYEFDGETLAVAFITDVTEQAKARRQLTQWTEELENRVRERTTALLDALDREKKLNELKSRFVSMASHEFRTPLSVVQSSTYLIEQYLARGHTDQSLKHLERIKSAVNTMNLILDDFLSLDKLEQGNVEVTHEQLNLSTFFTEIVDEMQLLLKKDQHIDHRHKGQVLISMDTKKLKYILINLLSNAIKYSANTIELNTENRNTQLHIEVKDSGIGVPEQEQGHLFEKFFRANNVGTIQGTGLGLTIVKRYVELLGGRITFSSIINKGTTFVVSIPT